MGEIQVEAENKKYEPKIAAFLCNWCSYAGADLAGVGRVQYPATIRTIRVPCSGRINPLYVLKAMANGADGVLVSGCHPGDCHYISGNYVARRKFALIKSLLNHVGLEEDRVNFSWVSAAEGIRFAEVVKGVTERVSALGPNNGIFKVVDDGGAAADE
ncbi:hydrogenase iron-sulfur subunit [Desulfosporosinus meridiei]|uniref:Coenzyme F420-reducing hydrogenase, delta subunit n=1 Tax=Desulfosporosinus meridiei (strain ATCC BAA-275 / DSM 13257 / KCTC 12902 / NCIMB 13706 / S10) TaxID=768704 RepID=J7IZL8_DESMD|nr:hydrogenase iron-sulfur subunit [Desulfosporosinus meridiei]AFQ44161.1 coenzyme F420-reducing hydrogenase, delta subunit [Desulfosporosinus meridiei DSM 13257]